MNQTKTIILLSGVEAEITRFKPKHQQMLGKMTKRNESFIRTATIHKIIADCTIRVANDNEISEKKVKQLLSGDIGKLLLEIRNFTIEAYPNAEENPFTIKVPFIWNGRTIQHELLIPSFFEEKYYFFVEEKLKELKEEGVPLEHDAEVQDENGGIEKYIEQLYFEEKENEEGIKFKFLKKALFESYEEILRFKEQSVILTLSQKEVHYKLMDGDAEIKLESIPEKSRDIFSALKIRQPRELRGETKDGSPSYVAYNLMSEIVDNMELQSDIQKKEADIYATGIAEHPYDSSVTQKINFIANPEFFFPSISQAK